MPHFRRPRNPNTTFKLVAAVFVLTFYLLWSFFHPASSGSAPTKSKSLRPQIQREEWRHVTHSLADASKAERVRDVMRFTYKNYKERAWGADDILPVSGAASHSGNGWAGFIVDSAPTLVLVGLWDELAESVDFIISNIDFTRTDKLVDPFEATTRYLGGLLSLIDLSNAGLIPEAIISQAQKDGLLRQALVLAQKLAPAYDTPTGMPWPLINFSTATGHSDPSVPPYSHPTVRTGHTATILENRALSHLTSDPVYLHNATRAWSHFVWSPYETDLTGLPDGPVDIVTGAPVGREKGWDAAYHSALLKASMMLEGGIKDRYAPIYLSRWHTAAQSLRHALVSRNAPAAEDGYAGAHLFLGRKSDTAYINEMVPATACAAPGTLLLGAQYLASFPPTSTQGHSDADEKGTSLTPSPSRS
ncbi:Mannosyl-oligosaccharide alpha-1,2-mannosidase 1B [Coniosporium tulheliwenetii]|uniref:Mannosyl-oligosaccharide alpha-1,2-mannosidase 1B n=1 Tax=Coniosporium tulheliwenetii TaxID=3383036 RepID=A0ACC2YL13_9PEZI|nr:Mannosyl-oligosaccharide alpha-1,2-mannosidase 1B [Cladosporium sp. JES 115]